MKVGKTNESRDHNARAILSTKSLITLIVKELIPEFKAYSREEIASFIEAGMATANKIMGINNEDGKTQRDIIFYMKDPQKDQPIGILINMEMQRSSDTSSLLQRAVYNISKVIANQKDVVFAKDEYKNIAKVYSLWILPYLSFAKQDSITYIHLTQNALLGDVKEESANFDLMGIYLLRLGSKKDSKLLEVLNLIFRTLMEKEEKIRILKEEYDVHLSEEAQEEVREMMVMGEWFKEEGIQLGKLEGIKLGTLEGKRMERITNLKNIMSSFHVDLETAMNSLKLNEEEKEEVYLLMKHSQNIL